MENKEIEQTDLKIPHEDMWRKIEKSHRRGKIMGGLLIIAIGSLFLAKELGMAIPAWVFTWKMLLIGLGVVAAVKHKFMHPGWLILVGVGGAFLLNDLYPDLHIRPFLWPVLIIMLGLFILFKPRRKHMHHARHYWKKWHQQHHHMHHGGYRGGRHMHHRYWDDDCADYSEQVAGSDSSSDDYINSTSVLGGVKKIIISKKFKGGEITNVFGGANINLSQADFETTATLEITQVFGGTKLIVPSNWDIKISDTVTILGSIEDKRPARSNPGSEPERVLVLVGTTVFGGIEINSFN